MNERNNFKSRIGFILTSAGCAIGLGNIWRFPYMAGHYGGGIFILFYLFFLLILGLPLIVMELAIGRSSKKSISYALDSLEPKGSKYHIFKYPIMLTNYGFMMFYTMVSGWVLYYTYLSFTGKLSGVNLNSLNDTYNNMISNPTLVIVLTIFIIIAGFLICGKGVQDGVEKLSKIMLTGLFLLLIALAIYSLTLDGRSEGLKFYLIPDITGSSEYSFIELVNAAMGQAFYTLGVGAGTLTTFGSYIDKKNKLSSSALLIIILDTCVALIAGLIIFPSCFTYGINVDSGPNLIFVTLPLLFSKISYGRILEIIFFTAMMFASFTTVISAFESITACFIDITGVSRTKSIIVNMIIIITLSLPSILGFNLWSGIQPFGLGSNIMDLEDFIISNNLLPIGCLIFVIFCTSKSGWGWKNFIDESNSGTGLPFPEKSYYFLRYIAPVIIFMLFISGYISKFLA